MLEFCRSYCAGNAEIAGLKWQLSGEEAFRYMRENDDEIQKEYEQKQWAKEREMLEKNNLEIPRNNRGTDVKFKATRKGKTVEISIDHDNKDLTNEQKGNLQTKALFDVTGVSNQESSRLLLAQANSGMISGGDPTFIANAVSGLFRDLGPQDAAEGMLCSRLVVLL